MGDGLFDALILWRNEREQPLKALLEAFELKTRACLELLDREAEMLAKAPFSIGQVTLGCALGYLDYRFGALGRRGAASRPAAWFATLQARPSFQSTEPMAEARRRLIIAMKSASSARPISVNSYIKNSNTRISNPTPVEYGRSRPRQSAFCNVTHGKLRRERCGQFHLPAHGGITAGAAHDFFIDGALLRAHGFGGGEGNAWHKVMMFSALLQFYCA